MLGITARALLSSSSRRSLSLRVRFRPSEVAAARPVARWNRWQAPALQCTGSRLFSERRIPSDQEEEEKKRRNQQQSLLSRGTGAALTAMVVLSGKVKWVFAALKVTKMLPLASMLASTGAYAMFYGWPFAVGMVGLIAVHEAGHLFAMKYYNIPAGPAIFVPFMGAFIEMKDRPKDVKEEAMVAIGGPITGSLGALALSIAGASLNSQMLIALADFGLMINLFNLLPIGQLDGGRIGGAVSPWFLVAGMTGGGFMIYNGMIHNPIFYLIMLSGAFTTYDRFLGSGTHESYHRIPFGQKARIGAGYIGLIVALLVAMAWNQNHKKSLHQLHEEQPEHRVGSLGRKFEKFAEEWKEDDDDARRVREEEERFVAEYFKTDRGV